MTTPSSAPWSILPVAGAWLVAASAGASAAQPPDAGLPRLERELARLAANAEGTVGLAATHVETGRTVVLGGGNRFPMASVRKLPTAIRLLALVDEGKERLDRTIELKPTDLRPGSGTLSVLLDDPGVRLPLRTLLELMLLVSDNTATDLVMAASGGPAAITAHLKRLGIDGVRVDRPILQTQADLAGVALPKEPITLQRFEELSKAVPEEKKKKAQAAFEADPRDTSTPEGMATLLARLWRGELLSPKSTELLLDVMRRAETGAARLKGALPPGTVVHHKTGTMGRTTNDVGVIALPAGGHVAIAAFVKEAGGGVEKSEQAIAQHSRAVYDYFRFRPAGDVTSLALLEDELARVAPSSRGVLGVGALHVETGRNAWLNPHVPFPMASTVKVPIAHRLFERLDRGEVSLETMIPLTPGDLHPGSGTLTELFDEPGISLSLRNYVELMLLISDNSATDVVLRQAGGPAQVTRSIRDLGIEGMRIDRSILRLLGDAQGVSAIPPNEDFSIDRYREVERGISDEQQRRFAERFRVDPRDTTTPEAMVALLDAIWAGNNLSGNSRELLVDIMRRCRSGKARLKGLLPPGTEVAHKTGTLAQSASDVGIVFLPDGAGHVIVAAYVKDSPGEDADRERALAHAARAVYDFFLFSP
jgi:beta-lactamase class A